MDRDNRIQEPVAVYLVLTADKIRYAAGRDTVDEDIKVLHHEVFCLEIFKGMIKSSRDCESITQDIINENKVH